MLTSPRCRPSTMVAALQPQLAAQLGGVAAAVVGHRDGEPVGPVAQPHDRPARLRVGRDVEQRLPHGAGDLVVGVVGQPDHVALDAQLHREVRLVLVGHLVEQLGQRRDGVAVRLVQRVDRAPQLVDGVLRQLLRGGQPVPDLGAGLAEPLGVAAGDLDGHPGGEDVLGDAVVQLAGDPVPLAVDQLALVGQQQPLLDAAAARRCARRGRGPARSPRRTAAARGGAG